MVWFLNPLTPEASCKKCIFLDILVVFRLDLGQISFNLVKNAFAKSSQQLAFLATSNVLQHCDSGMCRKQNFGRESDLRLQAFRFLEFFFCLSFFCFCFLYAAVIDLLLGLAYN